MNCTYITSAKKPEQLPAYQLPEIGLVGRSNCGKSSLINALLKQRQLARASRTPGRTQMVNFFDVNKRIIVADLPGYGWSQTGRETRKDWEKLIEAYVQRPNIQYLLFLIDARRKLDSDEALMLQWLSKNGELVVVLTKSDKLSKNEQQKAISQMSKSLKEIGLTSTLVKAVSSSKKLGVDELRNYVGIEGNQAK